ncbi:hypothetical protein [Corynebacterium deserti]|nr:hypothetical protein [Corynebacterium deserti]
MNADDMDADSFITETMHITGYIRYEVTTGIHAMSAMTHLPRLRAIQE